MTIYDLKSLGHRANLRISLKNANGRGGLHIVVPRSAHKLATKRNKIRRRIREVVRECGIVSPRRSNLRVDVYRGALELSYQELRKEVSELLNAKNIK